MLGRGVYRHIVFAGMKYGCGFLRCTVKDSELRFGAREGHGWCLKTSWLYKLYIELIELYFENGKLVDFIGCEEHVRILGMRYHGNGR